MCALNVQPHTEAKDIGEPIINDFAFSVATKNGSGSQTSNNVLVQSLFQMGIPVNGKNLFPSNIKGLPTWYTIRASKDGYTARKAVTEIVVAFNDSTVAQDVHSLPVGGVCITTDKIRKFSPPREDITYYVIPVKEIMGKADVPKNFSKLVENMTYVGAVAQLFDIPLEIVHQALLSNFGGKEKPAQMNMNVIELAYEWVADNITKSDPYCFEPLNLTDGKIMITGNEAGALGALFGGMTLAAWYPITPSTSLIDAVIQFKDIRKDKETGKDTVAVVQAEDELAAVGMIIGGGWAGGRTLTATSGPGISLMSEFVGLAYFSEIPCVIWDITRMGPSTGLPTRTSQGDLLFVHFLGHGDTRQICLLPATVEEAFEFGWKSFDLADALQTPVFVLSDLDLGMNNWMAEPFAYPDQPINHGKILDEEQLQAFIEEHGKWGRYLDVDGDSVSYRTIPGNPHPMSAYLARGTGHDEMAVYSENSEVWLKNMSRLRHKMDTAKSILPAPIIDRVAGAEIGLISYGTNDPAILEARDTLSAQGIKTSYLRVRALPMAQAVTDFLRKYSRVYVIENNFDGQLQQLIRLEHAEDVTHIKSLALGDGLPMTADWIVDRIMNEEKQ